MSPRLVPGTNWSGNVTFRAHQVHRPRDVDELRRLVAGTDRIRALGTAHSFSTVADTTGDLVSLAAMPATIEIGATSVRVAAGLRYGEIAPTLHGAGRGLHNLGSLPHIAVGGACATGTHGSGVTHGSLATAVSALDLVGAEGDLTTLRRGDPGFDGAVVSLGSLGVVTHLTLDTEPTYDVEQRVYEHLPWPADQRDLEQMLSAAYSVSLFTGWVGPTIDQAWLKQRVASADETSGDTRPAWRGILPSASDLHPLPGHSGAVCTTQAGARGPWHERLPHFRLDHVPSSGEELQTEYFVPREDAFEAWEVVRGLSGVVAPLLQVSEIRTVAADDLWLSPCFERDSVALHFTWVKDQAAVLPVLRVVEEALAPFAPRPHWGKLFAMGPDVVRARFPRHGDFVELARRHDPRARFANDFVDHYLMG